MAGGVAGGAGSGRKGCLYSTQLVEAVLGQWLQGMGPAPLSFLQTEMAPGAQKHRAAQRGLTLQGDRGWGLPTEQ